MLILQRPIGSIQDIPYGSRPSPYWIGRGLKSLYILSRSQWQINQVTGRIGGTVAGTGVTFPNGWLKTPSSAGNGALLEHGLSVNIALPITIIAGWKRLNGSVSWSLLKTDTDLWTGFYGEGTGGVKTVNSNTFNTALLISCNGSLGSVFLASGEYYSASEIQAGTVAPLNPPSGVNSTTVALGWSRRQTANDNPAEAVFTHFAAIQGDLSRAELREIAVNPGRLFAPRRIYIPTATAAATAPTITSLSAISITATSAQPRITYA